jgi:hypothetical protein
MNTHEIALNLWNADEYGDGTHKGIILTAYPLVNGKLDTDTYKSVQLRTLDLPKRYVADDDWAYPGDRRFTKWLQLFISRQLDVAAAPERIDTECRCAGCAETDLYGKGMCQECFDQACDETEYDGSNH